MTNRFLFCVIIVLLFSIPLAGEGSFRVDTELEPLLNQQPQLKKLLYESFDMHWTGGANRIGQNVNERFGGRRIGPYKLQAKPKGAKGEYSFMLIFHTRYIFKDADGKNTTLENAFHISEELISVEIIPSSINEILKTSPGSELKLTTKTTLVQDFVRNYIGVPAFHSRGWKDGETVKINEQYFTIQSIRVSGEGHVETGTLASFDLVIVKPSIPTETIPTGAVVEYLGSPYIDPEYEKARKAKIEKYYLDLLKSPRELRSGLILEGPVEKEIDNTSKQPD